MLVLAIGSYVAYKIFRKRRRGFYRLLGEEGHIQVCGAIHVIHLCIFYVQVFIVFLKQAVADETFRSPIAILIALSTIVA